MVCSSFINARVMATPTSLNRSCIIVSDFVMHKPSFMARSLKYGNMLSQNLPNTVSIWFWTGFLSGRERAWELPGLCFNIGLVIDSGSVNCVLGRGAARSGGVSDRKSVV